MVRRLAAHKLRQKVPFGLEEARILVRSLMPERGNLERLAVAIHTEYGRQSSRHKERRAAKLAEELKNRPIWARLHSAERRKKAHINFAIRQFGDYVKNAFADDVIALLELLKHDHRLYEVHWVAGGVRPLISAVVKVTVTGEKDAWDEGFLLYKLPRTAKIMSAFVPSHTDSIRDAWAYQVPVEVVGLRQQGWRVRTDFEAQTLTVTGAGGEIVVPWQGAASHDGEDGEAEQ